MPLLLNSQCVQSKNVRHPVSCFVKATSLSYPEMRGRRAFHYIRRPGLTRFPTRITRLDTLRKLSCFVYVHGRGPGWKSLEEKVPARLNSRGPAIGNMDLQLCYRHIQAKALAIEEGRVVLTVLEKKLPAPIEATGWAL
jgi:hypothetical protein